MLLSGGRKRGSLYPSGRPDARRLRVLICEGWATGATLAALEPNALVLAAIDAGNLRPVATARREWPDVEIVIAADTDEVGVDEARGAAVAAEALVAVPETSPTGSRDGEGAGTTGLRPGSEVDHGSNLLTR
ncbi:MAG: toprim domain-containing protein [Arhodomonas sp.]|nr:toprim domain-containing protein [Arhodomonas sp.]